MSASQTTVSADDIIRESVTARSLEDSLKLTKLTGLQEAGMKIVWWVALIGAAIIIGLGAQWMVNAPDMPTLPDDQTKVKEFLANYKTAGEIALEGPTRMFELVVVKILYPLFTLILGYVFGSRTGETQESKT